HADQDLLHLAVFGGHQARNAALAEQDALAVGLGGNGAEDPPCQGGQEQESQRAESEPALGVGYLHELIELLGRGEPLERHFAEDHGSSPDGEGRVVKRASSVVLGTPSRGKSVPVSNRRSTRARARARCAETSDWRAAVKRSRWEITSIRVEVPARSFFSSFSTARSKRRTASTARSSCWPPRATASTAMATSAPICRARRSSRKRPCSTTASTWARSPRARLFSVGQERESDKAELAPGTLR